MLEVGWSELLVIAMVLIIVVGPKDLPKMLRTFGAFMRKARGMAAEFQGQFNDALKEAELDEVRKTIADVKGLNPRNAVRDALDPLRQAGEDVKRELSKADAEIKAKAAAPASPLPPDVATETIKPPVKVELPAAASLPAAMPSEFAAVPAVKAADTTTKPVKAASKSQTDTKAVKAEKTSQPAAKKSAAKSASKPAAKRKADA